MKNNNSTIIVPVHAYIASGWFNDEQEKARQDIIRALDEAGISYFSPKEEVLLSPNASQEEQKAIFKEDVEQINNAKFIVASTVGKDMGTLFEMGYAFANGVPSVVYFPAPKGMPCNLMIAQSAYVVCQDYDTLVKELVSIKESGFSFAERKTYNNSVE